MLGQAGVLDLQGEIEPNNMLSCEKPSQADRGEQEA